MMKSFTVALICCLHLVVSQTPKPGSCPNPPTQHSVYSDCEIDEDCIFDLKCCRSTSFYGRTLVCTPPANITREIQLPHGSVKPGVCPVTERKSRTNCSFDSDCTGNRKCCRDTEQINFCAEPL